MTTLVLGLLVFLGVHSLRVLAPLWRYRQLTRWGALPFKGVYALVSLLGFWLILQGYPQAKAIPLEVWTPPFWLRHLSVALMWPATIMLVAAYVPGNSIRTRLRHPMTLGVKTWALAHLLANGHIADLMVFGSFLVWAVLVYRAARREDRSQRVGMMGSAGMGLNLGTLLTLLLGTAVWFWLALGGGHLALIGVSPLG